VPSASDKALEVSSVCLLLQSPFGTVSSNVRTLTRALLALNRASAHAGRMIRWDDVQRRCVGFVELAVMMWVGHDQERRDAVGRVDVAIRLAVSHPLAVTQVVELERAPHRQVERQRPAAIEAAFERMG